MVFDHEQQCFTVLSAEEPLAPARRFRGLTRILKEVCYPKYDYRRAMRLCPQNSANKRSTGLSRPWHGTARGRLVHDQLRLLVNGGGDRALRAVYGAMAQPSGHVRRFLDALARKRLSPVVAEFADFYDELGLASAIDVICVSQRTGAVVLVEVKVGGENYFRRADGPLAQPPILRGFNNCPLHQAFLQLLFYRKMLVDHYADLQIGSCYVAQLCTDEVCFYRLPDEFISAQDELFACMATAVAERSGTEIRVSMR